MASWLVSPMFEAIILSFKSLIFDLLCIFCYIERVCSCCCCSIVTVTWELENPLYTFGKEVNKKNVNPVLPNVNKEDLFSCLNHTLHKKRNFPKPLNLKWMINSLTSPKSRLKTGK